MLLKTQLAVQAEGKAGMEIPLSRSRRVHAGTQPVDEPSGTTCLWTHCQGFDVSVHGFLPTPFNILVEKASS